MKRPISLLAVIVVGAVMASPAYPRGQQAVDPVDHSAHHPDAPATQTASPALPSATSAMTPSAKLDALVQKMNGANGAAKTKAMAELLTVLVQDRQSCEPMMANMMKMMDTMGGANGTMPMKPPAK
jgi:hypothetical protein